MISSVYNINRVQQQHGAPHDIRAQGLEAVNKTFGRDSTGEAFEDERLSTARMYKSLNTTYMCLTSASVHQVSDPSTFSPVFVEVKNFFCCSRGEASSTNQPCEGPCSNILNPVRAMLRLLSCQLLIVFIHLYSNNTGPTHRLYLPWQEILPARFEHDQRQPFLLAYMLALLPTSQSGFLFSYSFYIATALTSQKQATDLHVLKKKELRTAHTPGDRRPLY